MLCERRGGEGGVNLLNSPNFLGLTDTNALYKFYLLCSLIRMWKPRFQEASLLEDAVSCMVGGNGGDRYRSGNCSTVPFATPAGGQCIALGSPVLVHASVESDSCNIT